MIRNSIPGYAIVVVLIFEGALMGCSKQPDTFISGSGVIEAREVVVGARLPGEILELPLREGDRINQGDLIARTDVAKLKVQLEQLTAGLTEAEFTIKSASSLVDQAQVQLAVTQKAFDRAKTLLEKGSITESKYDEVKAAYEVAREQRVGALARLEAGRAKELQVKEGVRLLELQIADGQITAPLAGTVLVRYAEPGELAVPGKPLVKLADLTQVWVKVYVSSQDLAHIRLLQSAKIKIDGVSGESSGTVVHIAEQAEFTPRNVQTSDARAALVYAVKVEMPNPDGRYKIGMPVDVVLGERPQPVTAGTHG